MSTTILWNIFIHSWIPDKNALFCCPAEEGDGGAKKILDAGALDNVTAISLDYITVVEA